MKNAHIAFINCSHPPHVNPTLPVVSVMVRRGYRVTYTTSDRFASQIADLGGEVVPSSPLIVPKLDSASQDTPNQDTEEPSTVRLAKRMLSEITPFYETNKPDLIIYDFMTFAGRILAHRWKIQAVQTSPDYADQRRVNDRVLEGVADPQVRYWNLEYRSKVGMFLEQHGIPLDSSWPFHEGLNIHLFPRSFQSSVNVFGSEFLYAGRCAGEQRPYGDWQPPERNRRPIVVIGTSTTAVQGPDYFRMCIEAIREIDCRIVIYAGDKFDAGSLLPIPENCEIVRNTAQVKLLRYASLLICHGGIITPAEAAYYGVPLLMTTHGMEGLEMQAEVIAKLGLGIHLREADVTAENIARSATTLMKDPVVLNRIEQIRRSVVREPGAEETVNRIEEYLER